MTGFEDMHFFKENLEIIISKKCMGKYGLKVILYKALQNQRCDSVR